MSRRKLGNGEEAVEALVGLARVRSLTPAEEETLGKLQKLLGRYEESLAALERAVESAPHEMGCVLELFEAYARLGRLADAVEPLQTALEQHPRHGQAWRDLGRALLAADRPSDAAEAAQRSIEIERSAGAFEVLAEEIGRAHV